MSVRPVASAILSRLMTAGDATPVRDPEWLEAYRSAAAVLASFEPTSLRPFGHEPV